jgi:F0F1-type ATP synthase epsilon subunit
MNTARHDSQRGATRGDESISSARRPPLRVVVLTPRRTILEVRCRSLRVPTETGQVGLRSGCEPSILAVAAGVVVVNGIGDGTQPRAGVQLVGTAGGLLRCDREHAELLTPLAVLGLDRRQVVDSLDTALAEPRAEWETRQRLERLENRILQEFGAGGKAFEKPRSGR